jgi:hypothetical protein
MVTRYPDRDIALSLVALAADAAAADTAPRDPARAVKPTGTTTSKNAGWNTRDAPRTVHNIPADHMPACQNFPPRKLGAGPRAPAPRPCPRQLTAPCRQRHPDSSSAAAGTVADNAAAAPAAAPGPDCWPDTFGWPASAASAALPCDRQRCNNALVDEKEKTTAHSP